jgi:hypothetical protein
MEESVETVWGREGAKFLFDIGEIVVNKADSRQRYVIVGRHLHQCHGGFQREYAVNAPGNLTTALINETALQKFDSAKHENEPEFFGRMREDMRTLRREVDEILLKLAKSDATKGEST